MTPIARCTLTAALLLALPAAAGAPRDLDLAFVLDTTGSMSGEIREAKERIRQVAEALAASRPGARVRLGVVAYRDRTDDYLTKVAPLTPEVDAVDAFLSALRAGGGGDSPEDVLSGLAAALGELDWDESSGTDRQLFLIGDAPAHLDYADGRTTESIVEEARRRRIVLNAIGCRSLGAGGVHWFRELAYATEGAYHHVGRVELGGGKAPGVADAVVATLAREPDAPRELHPVELRRSDAVPPDADGSILVERLTGESCLLAIALPPGYELNGEPRAAQAGDALEVTLRLASGQGGGAAYELSPCPPAALPIRVSLED